MVVSGGQNGSYIREHMWSEVAIMVVRKGHHGGQNNDRIVFEVLDDWQQWLSENKDVHNGDQNSSDWRLLTLKRKHNLKMYINILNFRKKLLKN